MKCTQRIQSHFNTVFFCCCCCCCFQKKVLDQFPKVHLIFLCSWYYFLSFCRPEKDAGFRNLWGGPGAWGMGFLLGIATFLPESCMLLKEWVFGLQTRAWCIFASLCLFSLIASGAQVALVLLSLLLSLLSFRVEAGEASFLLVYLKGGLIFQPGASQLS